MDGLDMIAAPGVKGGESECIAPMVTVPVSAVVTRDGYQFRVNGVLVMERPFDQDPDGGVYL